MPPPYCNNLGLKTLAGRSNMDGEKDGFKEITEGKAAILYPASESVFYNPVQQFNRDLSILAIKHHISVLKGQRGPKSTSNSTKNECKIGKEDEGKGLSDKGDELVSISKEEEAQTEKFEEKKKKNCDKRTNSDVLNSGPKPIRILEGLAATGLRSIRYALEIGGIDKMISNDFSAAAFENIKRNIDHNKIGKIVEPSLCDAG